MNKTKCLPAPGLGRLCFSLLGGGCIFLLLFCADSAVTAVQSGLQLCYRTVIPALFPFMVASELLVGCGGAAAIGQWFSKPVKRLLGIPGAAACPILLGAMCGFPTGARAAAALYDKGELNAAQCTRLLTFINTPSSAYLISAVGVSLLGSRRLGVIIWVISLLCSLITALVTRILMPCPTLESAQTSQPVRLGADVFTNAVTSAAQSMLAVCAYVLFFSAVLGAFQSVCARFALPAAASAILYGIVEMSGGIAKAAAIQNQTQAAMLCAALSCWSGVSVLCQIITVCRGRGFRFLPYVLAKLAQALCAAALTGLAMRYLLPLLPSEQLPASVILPVSTVSVWIQITNIGFIACCAAGLIKSSKKRAV